MKTTTPRYRQLADHLRRDILRRKLEPGTTLLTEMEICAAHEVSRHTAREALRILTEDGLIERRRGAGTVVAERRAPAFAQSINDFDSILQYARDAHLMIIENRPCTDEKLDLYGLTGSHHSYRGIRQIDNEPAQALTTVIMPTEYAPPATVLSALRGPISEWLEAEHLVSIQRVTQRMEACLVDVEAAQILGVEAQTAALRTTRRYRNGDGDIIILSESLHPAGRFAYEMRLDRNA